MNQITVAATMYLKFTVDAAAIAGLDYDNLPATLQLGDFTLRMRAKLAKYPMGHVIPVALFMGRDGDGTNAVVEILFPMVSA